jgi:nicotinamidase-related amidase
MPSALLVIDVQRGMFMPPAPAHRGEEVVDRIAGLLARARAGGLPVIHVQHDGGPGDILGHGKEGWQIHPGVAPQEGEPVVEKRYCSAFQDTDLQARLDAAGIRRLVVAGLQTEFCIDTTCRAAAALGYQVVLAADAHTTFDSPILPAAKIIAHHNHSLNGTFCELVPAADIQLST